MSVDLIGDHQLSRLLSHHPGVQDALDKELRKAAAKARKELAEHYYEGHAEIETETYSVDRFLILSDERGRLAAMSIEKGRKAGPNGKGRMIGLDILGKAFRTGVK